MGDFMPPKKQQVVNRIKERLERCRKHQELSLSRYDSTKDERWSQERQEKEILHQRYQDNRSRRQPKGPKQDGGQNKTKTEGNATGTGGAEGPGSRQQILNKHSERKRPHSEATNGPDPSTVCESQANGFDDTASKRPCTEISVQIVQKTGEQTDLTVTTTIQQSGDSSAEASNNNMRSQNGCKTSECPSTVNQSNGQHQGWTDDKRQDLEKLLDDPERLEEFMKQLENDPEQMKSFEAELEKICNKIQQDLGDGAFPDAANLDSQPAQEVNSGGDAMPVASGSPVLPAVPSLSDGTKLPSKQGAPTMPVAPMVRGAPGFNAVPSPSDGNLKQRVKTEMAVATSEPSEVYDPMMKGPPNTVATDARTGKEGPLPAIAEFKNPAVFDATNIKIEPQAGGAVDGPNLLQAQFQQKQGQVNLLNQKQTPQHVNQLQSSYRSAQQQHGGPNPGTQLSHYANQQQQQQVLQQQQQQGGGITATGSQFGMQMSRSLQSLQDQLKQRPHTLAGAIGGTQNLNTAINRARFSNTRQNQVTGRLPSVAQIFAQNRLNSQQVQQQQQQQQQQPQQQQPAAFPVDGGIQQVRQNMPGTQQQQLLQQPQQQQQQAGQFVQQRPTLSPAKQQLLRQQMLQRQLRQQQQSQLLKLTPEQRFLLLTKRRQLVQQKQNEFQMYQRGPPPRYDETQHRNTAYANSPGLMQQTPNASTNQMTGGISNNALMAGNIRQGNPLQQTVQQSNLHHQGMRTNQTMIQAGQIGTTGTQLSQGLYPNQAQAQFIQRRQQLLQNLGRNNMQMPGQVGQQTGTVLNQLGRSRVQGPNSATNLGAAEAYMKQQMRVQNPGQMSAQNVQGSSAMAGKPIGQTHQVSTVARFPNNLINTSTNVRTFMQNMPTQNMSIHTSMTTQAVLQQQQQQQGYGNQPSIATSSVMPPTSHSEPSIVTAMSSVATSTTQQVSFSANSTNLPMDLLDSNVNLGNTTMSNVDFDLDLLENILKTK